jgi:hypothetical protein
MLRIMHETNESLIGLSKKFIAAIDALPPEKEANANIIDLGDQISELESKKKELWKEVMDNSIASAQLIMDVPFSKSGKLVISPSERDELINQIDANFINAKNGIKNQKTAVDGAVYWLRRSLVETPLKNPVE